MIRRPNTDPPDTLDFAALTEAIAADAAHYDSERTWPQRSLDALTQADIWQLAVPADFGGATLDPLDQLRLYEAVARGSVAVALILTQRDGAIDLLASGENEPLKQRLLPDHAAGERFTSVGIAQLTTSKGRDGKPHMTAARKGDHFVLHGAMPWVTGAAACDEIVCGAVLDDGDQLLCCVPGDGEGVYIDIPFKLLALEHSGTARVQCENVEIPADLVIRGPAEKVLQARAPVKPLVVSSVGLGLAGAIVDHVRPLRAKLDADLAALADEQLAAYDAVRARLYAAGAQAVSDPEDVPKVAIRVSVNDLLTKLAVLLLSLSKGRGFTRPQPAERLLREAMFFHVWSATDEVKAATLQRVLHGDAAER